MPKYFFDIKDGHRMVDASGMNFKNNEAAVARAKVFAIQVSLDTPKVDPTRYIAVLNEARGEVSRVPVYSKPEASSKPHKVNLRKSI